MQCRVTDFIIPETSTNNFLVRIFFDLFRPFPTFSETVVYKGVSVFFSVFFRPEMVGNFFVLCFNRVDGFRTFVSAIAMHEIFRIKKTKGYEE